MDDFGYVVENENIMDSPNEDDNLNECVREPQIELSKSIFGSILTAYNILAATKPEECKKLSLKELRIKLLTKYKSMNYDDIKMQVDLDKMKTKKLDFRKTNDSAKENHWSLYGYLIIRTAKDLTYTNEAIFQLIMYIFSEELQINIELCYTDTEGTGRETGSNDFENKIKLIFNVEFGTFSIVVNKNSSKVNLPIITRKEIEDSSWLNELFDLKNDNSISQFININYLFISIMEELNLKLRVFEGKNDEVKHRLRSFHHCNKFPAFDDMNSYLDNLYKNMLKFQMLESNETVREVLEKGCEREHESSYMEKIISILFDKESNDIFHKEHLFLFQAHVSFNEKLSENTKDRMKWFIRSLLILCCSTRLNTVINIHYRQTHNKKTFFTFLEIPPAVVNVNDIAFRDIYIVVDCNLGTNRLKISNMYQRCQENPDRSLMLNIRERQLQRETGSRISPTNSEPEPEQSNANLFLQFILLLILFFLATIYTDEIRDNEY
jgi:hypothetical protein